LQKTSILKWIGSDEVIDKYISLGLSQRLAIVHEYGTLIVTIEPLEMKVAYV